MTLSDEEIRVKVAEAAGWKKGPRIVQSELGQVWITPSGLMSGAVRNGRLSGPPDYPTDLDACAYLRAGLSEEERVQYIAYLVSQVSIGSRIRDLYWAISNATPRQHCLAFLKCKGVEI